MKFEPKTNKQLMAIVAMAILALCATVALIDTDADNATNAIGSNEYPVHYYDDYYEEYEDFRSLTEALDYALNYAGDDDLDIYIDGDLPRESNICLEVKQNLTINITVKGDHKILFNPTGNGHSGFEMKIVEENENADISGALYISGGIWGLSDYNVTCKTVSPLTSVFAMRNEMRFNCMPTDFATYTTIDATNVHSGTKENSAVVIDNSSFKMGNIGINANDGDYSLYINGLSYGSEIRQDKTLFKYGACMINGDIFVKDGYNCTSNDNLALLDCYLNGDIIYTDAPNAGGDFYIEMAMGELNSEHLSYYNTSLITDAEDLNEKIVVIGGVFKDLSFIDYAMGVYAVKSETPIIVDREIEIKMGLLALDETVFELTNDGYLQFEEGAYCAGTFVFGINSITFNDVTTYNEMKIYVDNIVEKGGPSLDISGNIIGEYSTEEYDIIINSGKVNFENMILSNDVSSLVLNASIMVK